MPFIDEIKVNEKLKNDILGRLPKDYSDLEKAIFIYYELCKKLNYSLDYLVNNDEAQKWLMNIENIEKVDGTTNNEVVCFTFNTIFAKLLFEAQICDESIFSSILIDENGMFSPRHMPLVVKIDGFNYIVDSSKGVFDNNDLTLAKYSTHKLNGWTPEKSNNDFLSTWLQNSLNNAITKVQSENLALESCVNNYISTKLLDGSFETLVLDEKVKIFLAAINNCPGYGALAFNYLLKLKRKLFSSEELGKTQAPYHIDLFFGKHANSDCLEAFLFYNPKGYANEFGQENFDDLQIYQISVKNKQITRLQLSEFNKQIKNCSTITRGISRDSYTSGMTIIGSLKLIPIIEDGNKIVGYTREYSNGKTEVISVEEGEKLKADYKLMLEKREAKLNANKK